MSQDNRDIQIPGTMSNHMVKEMMNGIGLKNLILMSMYPFLETTGISANNL